MLKIALISDYSISDYKEYGKEKNWSTGRGIFDALKSNENVFDVRMYPVPKNDRNYGFLELKNHYDSEEFVPDIILLMNSYEISLPFWNKETFPKSILVYEAGDEHPTHHFHIKQCVNSDVILTPSYDCYEDYLNSGYKCIHTSHWADTNIFYASDNETIEYDVVSSMMYGDRQSTINYLKNSLKEKFLNRIGLVDIENGNFYRKSKIVFQKSKHGEVTRRIFEGMACKKMVIADKLDENKKLESLFEDGKDIVLYSSLEDAVDKIKYFLHNNEEREKIAQNGYTKVMKNHTTKKIAEILVNIKG